MEIEHQDVKVNTKQNQIKNGECFNWCLDYVILESHSVDCETSFFFLGQIKCGNPRPMLVI